MDPAVHTVRVQTMRRVEKICDSNDLSNELYSESTGPYFLYELTLIENTVPAARVGNIEGLEPSQQGVRIDADVHDEAGAPGVERDGVPPRGAKGRRVLQVDASQPRGDRPERARRGARARPHVEADERPRVRAERPRHPVPVRRTDASCASTFHRAWCLLCRWVLLFSYFF